MEKFHGGASLGRASELALSPSEYGRLVYKLNELVHNELRTAFSASGDHLSKLGVSALAIPGSDGRFEKGSDASAVEIIALLSENVQLDLFKSNVIDVIKEVLCKVSPHKIVDVEIKHPLDPRLTHSNGSKQPARLGTDARPVFEQTGEEILCARVSVGREILSMPGAKVKNMLSSLEGSAWDGMNGTNRIKGVDALHFDLKGQEGTGTVFYNPEAFQLSFKIGPLRLVQNTLVAEQVKHLRRELKPDFLSTLRSNIPRRLAQLGDDHLLNLSRASVNGIIEHYNFFLRLYHKSEERYVRLKESVMHLTADEVVEIQQRLADLSRLMSSLKIGVQASTQKK